MGAGRAQLRRRQLVAQLQSKPPGLVEKVLSRNNYYKPGGSKHLIIKEFSPKTIIVMVFKP